MGHYLARAADRVRLDTIKRFDPRFWTINFPRPMMAAMTTPAADSLRVDAVFYRRADLAGVIWESEDKNDHPLLGYETKRDYRGLTLSFRWRADGVTPLDQVNGPVLTIEGRDAAGAGRAWYVRLWNYAVGTPADAVVTLDFDALDGGFLLPGEADRVFAGDIDRMFLSLTPPGFTGADVPLPARVEAVVRLDQIACEGGGAVLAVGDAFVPPHELRMSTAYDDSYNLTPARVLRNLLHLGYREWIDHYVGMSHYFELTHDAGSGQYLVVSSAPVLNVACRAWHAEFFARARALDYKVIVSLSYELFDQHAPEAWKQRAHDGAPAATGYVPPSTLLSPGSGAAMGYLQAVARAFVGAAAAEGLEPHFQVGEPWWWVGPDKKPCVHDAATETRYFDETGRPAPTRVVDATASLSGAQLEYFDWAGDLLGRSTLDLTAAARAEATGAVRYLLFYAPQVLNAAAANLQRLNLPTRWARPAFDVLQVEDYDFVIEDDLGAQGRALQTIQTRLGYPIGQQHYFAGFALQPDLGVVWERIARAAAAGRARGAAEVFVWAYPQVARDGFTHFTGGEDAMAGFDDVLFPLALGLEATAGPSFLTQVITTASGHEQRNSQWADARLRFDAGLGVRAESDLFDLIAFFRARRGRARGFLFRDPTDFSSAGMVGTPTVGDQLLGVGGDGRTRFDLVKRYDPAGIPRRITRPDIISIVVSVGGVVTLDWDIEDGAVISLWTPPAAGLEVRAGFLFNVPVRFAEDNLEVSLATFRAGALPSVPLVEIREG